MEHRNEENPVVKDIFINIFKETWDADIKKLSKAIGIKMARSIKIWRVEESHSWRSVAGTFVEKYPEISKDMNIVSGNQISGMQLCEAAMKKLNETIDQGWN